MSNNPVRNTGPLGNADALARQAHANAMRAAQEEFAAVMRQLNQLAQSAAGSASQTAEQPQTAESETTNG
jgi:hypothetical protein